MADNAGQTWLRSVPQVALLRLLGLGESRKVLADYVTTGMPRLPDGRYDAIAAIAWLKEHWKAPSKAATPAEVGDTITRDSYEALDAKYKALERRQRFQAGAGMLMPKIDAEREMLRMAMQVRASLMAQPEILAAQLAHHTQQEIAKQLMERFRWMCSTFEDGMVPLTAEVGSAIDDLVAKFKPEDPHPIAHGEAADV